MKKSESIASLAEALSKAQGEIVGAKKDENNPFFKSKYADLASVWDACRGPLSKHGLSVIQAPTRIDGDLVLLTVLAHRSGEWVESEYPLRPVREDPQGMGSCLTYARRYALAALVGVYQIDDDGNDASTRARGVFPEQPPLGDGHSEPGVEIPYGPLAKQLVHRADPVLLRDYVLSIEKKAKDTGKPIPKWAEPIIAAAEPVIAAFENAEPGLFSDFKER